MIRHSAAGVCKTRPVLLADGGLLRLVARAISRLSSGYPGPGC